ncbi:hypothetical protein ACP70R_027851 [Stipagrostis hirtigluma subsp. patula]
MHLESIYIMMLLSRLKVVRRYFAYRKGLLKLKFIQFEKVALENINLELSSKLETSVDHYDSILIDNYLDRMKLTSLARECATQAQQAGIVLVEEALPIRALSKEAAPGSLLTAPYFGRSLYIKQRVRQAFEPHIKHTVKQAFDGTMGSLHRVNKRIRERAGGGMYPLVLASTFATVAVALGNNWPT